MYITHDNERWYTQIRLVIDCFRLFTAVGRSSAFGFPWHKQIALIGIQCSSRNEVEYIDPRKNG